MPAMTHQPLCLYAVVPAGEARALCGNGRDPRHVTSGPVAAVVGKPGNVSEPRAALRHDRIVRRAVEICSSVVPFRLGVELQSEAELHRLLEVNRLALSGQLAHFHGRVEMGLRAKLTAPADGEPMRLFAGLERVRTLAPHDEDRREWLRRASVWHVFEGCYLISRQATEAFWSVVEEIRRTLPALPLLGSGPWAAYSFCDFTLRPIPGRAEGCHSNSMRR